VKKKNMLEARLGNIEVKDRMAKREKRQGGVPLGETIRKETLRVLSERDPLRPCLDQHAWALEAC